MSEIADTIDTIAEGFLPGAAATPIIAAIPGLAVAAPFVAAGLALASAIARAGGTPADIERLAPAEPELDAMRAEWARRAAARR